MAVLTFRVNIPINTPARNPVNHNLISGASALHSMMIWSMDANANMDICGFRLVNRLGTFIIPDVGSHDNFTFGSGEDGWAAIPSQPQPIPLFDQVIEGPPYTLQLQFYNVSGGSALMVGGYLMVREPMAQLAQQAMIYEFLTSRAPDMQEASPETRTDLTGEKEKKPGVLPKVKIDVMRGFAKEKPLFEVKKK